MSSPRHAVASLVQDLEHGRVPTVRPDQDLVATWRGGTRIQRLEAVRHLRAAPRDVQVGEAAVALAIADPVHAAAWAATPGSAAPGFWSRAMGDDHGARQAPAFRPGCR